jgi:hypothetical protein
VPYSADYAFYRKNRYSLFPYTIHNEPRRDAGMRMLTLHRTYPRHGGWQ